MSTKTVQKFVLVLFTIVILMVINALLQESEFVPSFFGNSPSQGRVTVTGTDSTFSPTVTSEETSIEWSASKPFQNEENGENILDKPDRQSQSSASFSVSAPQKSPECEPVLTREFSQKNKNIFRKDFSNEDFADSRRKTPSDIVKNAPWPFSLFGGKSEVDENQPNVFLIPEKPLVPPQTVAVVERKKTAEKKVRLPSENDLNASESSQSPAPPQEAQVSAMPAPEPVLPPGYHVAPRVSRKPILPPAPVPASHEAPEILLSPALPQDITLPTLPPVEAKMRDFPPVEEKTMQDFPSVEGTEAPGLLKAPTLDEENAEMTPEKNLQDPIINEDALGNFPMAYGEMELVKPNRHFGVEKPVTIPDVPEEKESSNDLLTIDSVVDLPESERFREPPKAEK